MCPEFSAGNVGRQLSEVGSPSGRDHSPFLRTLIRHFGELLVYWLDIITEAKNWREEDGTFARRS